MYIYIICVVLITFSRIVRHASALLMELEHDGRKGKFETERVREMLYIFWGIINLVRPRKIVCDYGNSLFYRYVLSYIRELS